MNALHQLSRLHEHKNLLQRFISASFPVTSKFQTWAIENNACVLTKAQFSQITLKQAKQTNTKTVKQQDRDKTVFVYATQEICKLCANFFSLYNCIISVS